MRYDTIIVGVGTAPGVSSPPGLPKTSAAASCCWKPTRISQTWRGDGILDTAL